VITFTVTEPGPLGRNLGPNSRAHWSARNRATQAARDEWGAALNRDWPMDEIPFAFDRVRLTYRAYFCRRPWTPADPYVSSYGYRPKDADNFVASMKSALDGLVAAGLVVDDNAERVELGTPSITWLPDFEGERVEVLIEEEARG